MAQNSILLEKSLLFAARIVKLHNFNFKNSQKRQVSLPWSKLSEINSLRM